MISNRKDISAYKIFWQDRHYLSSSKIFHQNQFLKIGKCAFFLCFFVKINFYNMSSKFCVFSFFMYACREWSRKIICASVVIQKEWLAFSTCWNCVRKQLVYKFFYSLCCFTQSLDYERIVLYYFCILITT